MFATTGHLFYRDQSTTYDFLALAPLASPTFTGSPVLPTGTTAVTQSASNNSTKVATTAYTDAAVAAATSSALPSTKATSTSLAQTSSASVTFTPAADGLFQINMYVTVTAITSANFLNSVTYTDQNNNSQTLNIFVQGTASPIMSATGSYAFPALTIRCKGGTTITAAVGKTTGTVTFDFSSSIVQIAN
jgi:hypothetical protein